MSGVAPESRPPVPVPTPQPEVRTGEKSKAVGSSRTAGPGLRPKFSREDFQTVASKVRYDLTAAQAKLTELMAMVASLNLPSEAVPFSEEKGLTLVRNTAHVYTDSSLADELALMGADREFIDRALIVAGEVRREVGVAR